jgi:integrase
MVRAGTTEKFKATTVEKGIRQIGPSRWEVRVYAGRNPETGAIRHVSRSTDAGIKAARTLRAKLTTEVAEGKHGATMGTFGSLLDAWLQDGKQGRAETTMAGYRIKIESKIRPALGSIPLDRLTTRDLDRFYRTLLDAGTSPAMVMHYHRVISAALRQAEKWEMVTVSPARNANRPRVPVRPLDPPPPDRVRVLIDLAAASRAPETATVITTAALTGLRRGELCALRWSEVDWPGSALTVRHALWQTADGWGVKDPKSHQVRRIEMDDPAMAVLRGRWHRASEAAALAGIELAPEGYVFSNAVDGADPIMPAALTQSFRKLCKRAEESDPDGDPWPYRFHDLRHYTATELFRDGHSPRTVADRLGHADPALTLRVYAHDTKDQAQAAAASLSAGLLTG